MSSAFLRQLVDRTGLDDRSHAALAQTGVRSGEDLHSLAICFPSLAQSVPRLQELARDQVPQLSGAYVDHHARQTHRRFAALGAGSAQNAPHAVGTTVPPASVVAPTGQPIAARAAIDLRLPSWPVRLQGERQTCVAFSVAACLEHLLAGGGAADELSVQFLYWAIKTGGTDPHPDRDTSRLAFAREAVTAAGVCADDLWRYSIAVPNPVSGQTAADPSASARADAASRKHPVATFEPCPNNAASRVHALLTAGRPVAVTLAVFCDPTTLDGPSNWGGPNGWCFGRVLGPPPHAVSVGGHCVCITGFVPDPLEPLGGHFVLRNSWGTDWASEAPHADQTLAPERGYGEVSASYVDACCWELLQL